MPDIKQNFPIVIKPFVVPKIVIVDQTKEQRESGFKPIDQLPLSMLKDETLLELCEQFKVDVFVAAGRKIPA